MSKEAKEEREGRRRQLERVGEWCIIYSLPWFKTRSRPPKDLQSNLLEKKRKSRTKTKPESHPSYPGRQFLPFQRAGLSVPGGAAGAGRPSDTVPLGSPAPRPEGKRVEAGGALGPQVHEVG